MPKIYGGVEMNITDVPYIVSLHHNNLFFCGGSFIHKNWILTSALCNRGRNVVIRAGSSKHNIGGIMLSVEKFIRHPDYDRKTHDYDFALIKLNDWNDEGIIYETVSLPTKNGINIPNKSLMLLAGYGRTTSRPTYSLMGVYVRKWSQKLCIEDYDTVYTITDQMLCAANPVGGKGFCDGDYGGPLIFEEVLVGVASFGFGCGLRDYPGVFGRVSSVRDWIHEISEV